MDDAAQFEPEFDTESRVEEDGSSHEQYAGAFFPKAKNFVVAGGKFKSITHVNQAAPIAPPDFRVIPLGDLNLLHEIRLQRGVDMVSWKNGGNSVRRMYTARIHGCKSKMTVALYQGNDAEDRWRDYISRYSDLRHAYLAQLYGVVNTANLHAAVFHDDLIPYTEVLEKHRDSHFTTVFLWNCINREFDDVNQYIFSFSGRPLYWTQYTAWIRSSTGHLCIDLTPPETNGVAVVFGTVDSGPLPSGTSLFTPPSESETITSVSLRDYHEICNRYLCDPHCWLVPSNVSVKLGSIRYSSRPEYESSLEVASTNCTEYDWGWATMDPIIVNYLHPINSNQKGITIMANGWIRIRSANVVDEYRRRILNMDPSTWLAQANYIFNCFQITKGFENFVSIHAVEYYLNLLGPTHNLFFGYLFLCPLAELQAEGPTCFRIPDCIAYWSLDPSGVDRLSDEVAEDLGFPAIEFEVVVCGLSWDASVYDGIRQFHEAKDFDPYSQEVAQELGCPLIRVSCDREVLLAHMQENDPADCYSDSDGDSYTEDGSEFGDEYDSASSELGDDSSIQVPDIDSVFCDAMDHTSRQNGSPTANEGPSRVLDESDANGYQCSQLEEAELIASSQNLNIVIAVQVVLILIATSLSLYEYFYPT